MVAVEQAIRVLREGKLDGRICQIYGEDSARLPKYRNRFLQILEGFCKEFCADGEKRAENGEYFGAEREVVIASAPGRTELGGNHTDHQNGNVLAGSVNLDVIVCASMNHTEQIRIVSEGYPPDEVDLSDLTLQAAEANQTAALIRGIAAAMDKRGFHVQGFDAYMASSVLGGSGLSSSAAYEVAVATVMNHFFCSDRLDAVEIAKIGQYAENVYFGKPCGLLDQMASSVGGIVAVDFKQPGHPEVVCVPYDMKKSGYALCLVDTGGNHKDLTDAYAAIPEEMKRVAKAFGKEVLREVEEKQFFEALPRLRETCGDRAILRAMHFFEENRRAVEEKEALERGQFEEFLRLVNASGRSSALYLQNVDSGATPARQEILLALAMAEKLLAGKGAVRVHGGGFAGTIQAFVPAEMLQQFKMGMEHVFGESACHVLNIRPAGGVVFMA